MHVAMLDDEMVIGGRHVDVAMLDGSAVDGVIDDQSAVPLQDLRQVTGADGSNVKNDEDGGGQIGVETAANRFEGVDAARRGSDNDDVVFCHLSLRVRNVCRIPWNVVVGPWCE